MGSGRNSSNTRVGLIGAGYIADFHARAISATSGATLQAVCDLSLSNAQKLARAHGVQAVFGSVDDMLAGRELDVVHVLVPPDAHAALATRMLEAGLHVLVEKPMCTTSADCRALAEAARARDRSLGTSHNFLFSPVYERLRIDVRSGRLGRLDDVEVVWNKHLPQLRSGPFGAFMFQSPGAIMLEIGPHGFAHLVDLLGEPEALSVEHDSEIRLPTGVAFFRRWRIRARVGETSCEIRFSLGEGYSEHRVHVRGSLASATADFERDTYQLHRHRPLSLDLDRYAAVTAEAAGAVGQATATLVDYAMSKAGARRRAAPYQRSITRAVGAFYAGLGGTLDERLAPSFSTTVVELGERVGRSADAEASHPPPRRAARATHRRGPADVLVTGGTGFIGRELVRQLCAKGTRVRVSTRDVSSVPPEILGLGVDIVAGRLRDEATLEAWLDGVSSVVHLARGYGSTWAELRESDVETTGALARACQRHGVRRLVYASSIAIYDAGPGVEAITEETPPGAGVLRTQPYARAKAETEQLLMEMWRSARLPVVVVRPGIVIGRGGDPRHFGVGMWSHDTVVELWGSGTTPLPIVLVGDVARAVVRCLEVEGIEGESFNLVGEPCLSGQEYLDELERCAGVKLTRVATPLIVFYGADVLKWLVKTAVGHPNRCRPSYRSWAARAASARYDCAKAKALLGWEPTADRNAIVREGICGPAAEFLR